jgi:hypothetical protein
MARTRPRLITFALALAALAALAVAPAPAAAAPAASAPTPCGSSGSRDGTAPGNITSVQVSSQTGFDRFELTFSGGVPNFSIAAQDSATFIDPNSDRQIKLLGSAGLAVTLDPTMDPTSPSDIVANRPEIKEARRIQDFEAFVTWAIGVASPSCYRTQILNSPGRLIVDVVPT